MECLQGYSEIVRINPKTEKQRYRGVQKVLNSPCKHRIRISKVPRLKSPI